MRVCFEMLPSDVFYVQMFWGEMGNVALSVLLLCVRMCFWGKRKVLLVK